MLSPTSTSAVWVGAQQTMNMAKQDRGVTNLGADLASQIAQAVRDIRYGSVEITIHDGQVVQIERKEKLRFDLKPNPAKKA